jgi:hypothetical protein
MSPTARVLGGGVEGNNVIGIMADGLGTLLIIKLLHSTNYVIDFPMHFSCFSSKEMFLAGNTSASSDCDAKSLSYMG